MIKKKPILFSTHLMASVVILVTGSVILVSVVLSIYFGRRLESEFAKKILAQKGQAETILTARLTNIKQNLNALSTDNSLRVIIMMDDTAQVEESAKEFYSEIPGVSFFVKKEGRESIHPQIHPGLSDQVLTRVRTEPIRGDLIEDNRVLKLLWWLEAPILHNKMRMGDVFALYDMMQDKTLIHTLQQAIDDRILISKGDEFFSLTGGEAIPRNNAISGNTSKKSGLIFLKPEWILIPLDGFQNLYFATSKKKLSVEKQNVGMFIGLFTFSVLTVSVIFSIILGKRLGKPLSEIANKAYHISREGGGVLFEISDVTYLEFQRLSQVFNDMLVKLKNMEEKTRYTELMENVDDAVYLVDSKGKVIQANEATLRQIGHGMATSLSINLDTILPGNDALIIRNLLADKRDQVPNKTTIETFHITKDGNLVPVEIKARVIRYHGSRVILNVARDIRDRKEAERALRESEERYRSVVESSHDGILIMDDRRLIVYVNTQLGRIIGYPPDEIKGGKFIDFFPDTIASFAITQNREEGGRVSKSFTFTRKDGQERHGNIRATTITDPGGNHQTVVQLLDITERLRVEREKKQLEEQLLHAQKMQAIGTLAGGVAHDFNNLLQVINGYTELLMAVKDENDPELKQLQEIKNASKRASDLTDQLLTFSRKTESRAKPIDLNNEIEKGCRLLNRTLTNAIETEFHLAEHPMIISADPGRIQQVVMNLGVNARDAMPDGGKLTIETKNVYLDETQCKKYLEAQPGHYFRLSVIDTGHGMDEETMKHIFEPFYTTKTRGKGTGLGMSIVYGIVHETGGYITCYSEVDMGTSFKIYFPAAENQKKLMRSKDDDSNLTSPHGLSSVPMRLGDNPKLKGSETILLVDDEVRIRNLGVTLLSEFGYTVLTAANGVEALSVYQAKQKEIDLVILDLVMPEMDGKKCFEELKKMNPDINVILSSGYSNAGFFQDTQYDGKGIKAFIDKPYEFIEMLETIRDTLDKERKKS